MRNPAVGAYWYQQNATNPFYCQQDLMFESHFEWLPTELTLETARSNKISKNAKLVLRGATSGSNRINFHTGLKRLPGEKSWYVGDFSTQKAGKKQTHLIIVRVDNLHKGMYLFSFANLGQSSIKKRVAYAQSILGWVKGLIDGRD